MAPGVLMYQLPRPEGLPDVDTPRAAMLRLAVDLPALAAIPAPEREGLCHSLASTLNRARYHRARFEQILALMEARRAETAATFLTYDLFAKYVLFEATGVLGAVRAGVDELVYLVARSHSVAPRDADKQWTASLLMDSNFAKRPDLAVPEVKAMRARSGWYDEVNEYRNVLHHRGWRPGFAPYFPRDSDLPEARLATHNVMLVPDRSSLAKRARSHAWTYREGIRLESVIERALDGFEALLDDVCLRCWSGTVPAPGSMPREHTPNIMVSLVHPTVLQIENDAVLPLFTTRTSAEAFRHVFPTPELFLAELRPTPTVVAEPAFTFTLNRLRENPFLRDGGGDLVLVFDATDVHTPAFERMPLAQLFSAPANAPLSIPQSGVGGVERLFVWRGIVDPAL